MDDGVLNQRLSMLESGIGTAMQLADHAIKRAGVLEAALVQVATKGKIDFDALKAAVSEDFGNPSGKHKEMLDELIDELRQRML